MYNSVHYTDVPLLISRGFRYGFSDSIMWGVDKNLDEWQVLLEDGGFAKFGKRLPKGNTESHVRMTNKKFRDLFPVKEKAYGGIV